MGEKIVVTLYTTRGEKQDFFEFCLEMIPRSEIQLGEQLHTNFKDLCVDFVKIINGIGIISSLASYFLGLSEENKLSAALFLLWGKVFLLLVAVDFEHFCFFIFLKVFPCKS